MKRVFFPLVIVFIALAAVSTFAQGGGKAEANRVRFNKGRSSATIVGTLGNDEQMEYTFSARKGQSVTITNSNTHLFDFNVFTEDGGFNSDNVGEASYRFTVPKTGDYMFYIRKLGTTPKSGKFTLTLSIR